MKKKNDLEKSCALCEYSQELLGGDYYICKKKGIVEPGDLCRAFCFDPLKIKVSVRKIPNFTLPPNLLDLNEDKKEEAK